MIIPGQFGLYIICQLIFVRLTATGLHTLPEQLRSSMYLWGWSLFFSAINFTFYLIMENKRLRIPWSNQKWTIQRNWQQSIQDEENKTKTQHNMC